MKMVACCNQEKFVIIKPVPKHTSRTMQRCFFYLSITSFSSFSAYSPLLFLTLTLYK